MNTQPINKVLAENLRELMAIRGLSQSRLSASSGVAQTTISLYLRPDDRNTGKTGKAPSAKLSEVELLARALGVDAWELLRPPDSDRWKFIAGMETAYQALKQH